MNLRPEHDTCHLNNTLRTSALLLRSYQSEKSRTRLSRYRRPGTVSSEAGFWSAIGKVGISKSKPTRTRGNWISCTRRQGKKHNAKTPRPFVGRELTAHVTPAKAGIQFLPTGIAAPQCGHIHGAPELATADGEFRSLGMRAFRPYKGKPCLALMLSSFYGTEQNRARNSKPSIEQTILVHRKIEIDLHDKRIEVLLELTHAFPPHLAEIRLRNRISICRVVGLAHCRRALFMLPGFCGGMFELTGFYGAKRNKTYCSDLSTLKSLFDILLRLACT